MVTNRLLLLNMNVLFWYLYCCCSCCSCCFCCCCLVALLLFPFSPVLLTGGAFNHTMSHVIVGVMRLGLMGKSIEEMRETLQVRCATSQVVLLVSCIPPSLPHTHTQEMFPCVRGIWLASKTTCCSLVGFCFKLAGYKLSCFRRSYIPLPTVHSVWMFTVC